MLDARRRDLFVMYTHALGAVHGRQAVFDHLYAALANRPVYLAAVGKAAAAMAAGAFAAWGDAIHSAVVITRSGHIPDAAQREPRTSYLEAAHPIPDARSLIAGKALVDFVSRVPSTAQCLVLISGGASALVEVLAAGISLSDWQRINTWLLASGSDIYVMNALRSALSCILGGRLMRWLGAHHTNVLLISDVPGDDPRVIGSGLLYPQEDVPAALNGFVLPDWIKNYLNMVPKVTAGTDQQFKTVRTTIVANNAMARNAAADAARALGYVAYLHAEEIVGDVARAAQNICDRLLCTSPGVYIWGGETTLKLPENPGRGGRNQHLALQCAVRLVGRKDIVVLVAGTDGSDGVTQNTGAIVDGETLVRCDLDVQHVLAHANAATFLEASDDVLCAGSTGTNVDGPHHCYAVELVRYFVLACAKDPRFLDGHHNPTINVNGVAERTVESRNSGRIS